MGSMTSGRTRCRWAHRAALSLTTILASGLAVPAFAQSAPYRNLDGNGVDLTLGDFVMNFHEGSIGSGRAELPLVRQKNDDHPSPWDGYSFEQFTTGSVTTVRIVQAGRYSDVFTLSGGVYVSAKQNGQTLTSTGTSFVYQAADGTKITFTNPFGYDGVPNGMCFSGSTDCYLVATGFTSPNGATVTLGYRGWGIGGTITDWRLASVANSYGYSIGFTYQNNALVGASPPSGWHTRTSAKFFNSTVSTSVPQATVTYAYPLAGTTDITDMAGNVWEVTGTSVKRPGESTPSFSVGGSAGAVTSVTTDGVTTNYSLSVTGSTGTMTVTDPIGNATVIVSDLNITRPTSVTNAAGKKTSFAYDSAGNLTRVTHPEGNYINYTLDARGNVTEARQVSKTGSGLSDIVTSATYDATCSNPLTCNQPNTTTDSRGNVTNYSYDSTHGGVTAVTAPAPAGSGTRPETRYSYTLTSGEYLLTGTSTCQTSAAPSCVGTSDEVKTTVAFDSNANVTSVTAAAGDNSLSSVTTATYTALGDRLTVDGPLSGTADTTTFRYDAARRQTGVISADPDGAGALKRRARKAVFDSAGRVTDVETGTVAGTSDTDWAGFTSAQKLTTTWSSGRKAKDVLTSGGATYQVAEYGYDADGRLQCTALRMNSAVWGTPLSSACTPGTAGSFGPDRVTKTTYDAVGRTTLVQSGYGVSGVQADDVATAYTDNGLVASVTDAEGNKTSYTYDNFDRLSKTSYPDTAKGAGTSSSSDYEELTYTGRSFLVASRHLRGYASDSTQHIDYTYDHLGRLTAEDLPGSEPDVAYTYDLLGHMTGATQTGNALTFSYDALGRSLTQAGPLGTVSYQYDAAGQRSRTTWPDGFYVGYDRLVTGEVSAIRENGAISGVGVLATYAYDDLGRRSSLTLGNGTVTSYGYDNVSRLASLGLDLDGATTTNDVTTSFGYMPSSQIAAQTRTNDLYAWDGHFNVGRSYTTNGLNQYTAVGAISPGYDARGNLTTSGSDSYSYSSENLLTSATVSGNSLTLAYDPMRRLYQETGSTIARFLYDGTDIIGEADSSNVLQKRYVFGPGTDEPLVEYAGSGTGSGVRTFLQADERGSIVARSNESGAKTAINSYDEHGIPKSTNAGRFQYTGQAWIPRLGMYYYKARVYSPTLGRFMQTDPIGYRDGMNWYSYVRSDPINLSDPNGLECTKSVSIEYYDSNNNHKLDPGERTIPGSEITSYSLDCFAAGGPYAGGGPAGAGVSQTRCYSESGVPIGCYTSRVPEIRSKAYICSKLADNGFDLDSAWAAAYNDRTGAFTHVNRIQNNPILREGENWLAAASDRYAISFPGTRSAQIILWQLTKPIQSEPTPISLDALNAGFDGENHRGDSPEQLKAWCNAG